MTWLSEIAIQVIIDVLTWPFDYWLTKKCERAVATRRKSKRIPK
jgi:hypothetical protein